jgi:acetoin utilization deacetylase AcuC-like enzyme
MSKFKKGQSGNPSGRPKQESARIREALNSHSEEIIEALIKKCREGDATALKIALDRIAPPLAPKRDTSATDIQLNGNLIETANSIIQASLNGDIEPTEAKLLLEGLERLKPIKQVDRVINPKDNVFGSAWGLD